MKLHRAAKKPDWAKTAAQRRNLWQRLAAQTKGVATWGNLLTAFGLGLVIWGLVEVAKGQYASGAWLLFIGRICDVADGWVADQTGTKSPLGEAFDAGVDKLEMLAALAVLFVTDVIPLWAIVALALPHVVVAGIVTVKRVQGRHTHPSRAGKISTALGWLGLGGFVILQALQPGANGTFAALVYLLTVSSLVMGLRAAQDYALERRA